MQLRIGDLDLLVDETERPSRRCKRIPVDRPLYRQPHTGQRITRLEDRLLIAGELPIVPCTVGAQGVSRIERRRSGPDGLLAREAEALVEPNVAGAGASR